MAVKFKAFISYSQRDKPWDTWLHGALESYRIDKDLIGRDTPAGPVPKTLRPIFRDREDFYAGHSLTEQSRAALEGSQFLIVLCSPNAAKSKYVNEEVRYFKSLGRIGSVIPIILDGKPGDPERECFPATLRYKLGPDGALTDELDEVPIAADAQPESDGKEIAKQKVVAGLLGVGLDEIVRRAEQARKRQVRIWASLAVGFGVLAVLATASAVIAVQERNEATRQGLISAHEAYAGDLDQSELHRRAGDPDKAVAVLRKLKPKGRAPDVREFAWRHLWHRYDNHRHAVFVPGKTTGLDVSPDSKMLAIANSTSLVTLWDLVTGQQIGKIIDREIVPGSALFVAGGARIATVGNNGLRLWDRARLGEGGQAIDARVLGALPRDRQTLVARGEDGSIALIDAGSGRPTAAKVQQELRVIDKYAVSPDGAWVALGDDSRLVVLDAATGRQRYAKDFARGWEFQGLALTADGALLIAGIAADKSYEIVVWDIAKDVERARLHGPRSDTADYAAVAASHDGGKIALLVGTATVTSFRQRSQLIVWDARTGRELYALGADQTALVTAMAFSPTADVLATGSQDHQLRLWEAATGKLRTVLGVHHGSYTRDGDEKNEHRDEATVFSWSSTQGAGISMLLFSPDGSSIVTASAELGAVRIWNVPVEPDEHVLPTRADDQSVVAFSPDGSVVVTGDRSGAIAIWQASDGAMRSRTARHGAAVDRLVFSTNGETFASASEDGVVKLWHTADLADRGSFKGGAGATSALHLGDTRVVHLATSQKSPWATGPFTFELTSWSLGGNTQPRSMTFTSALAALAPDGLRLAVLEDGQGGCRWTVWTAASGASDALPIDSEACAGLGIQHAAWSPDGTLLAFAGSGVKAAAETSRGKLTGIRIFDVETRSERSFLELPLQFVGSLAGFAFSPDGSTLATLAVLLRDDGRTDARTGEPAVTLWDIASLDRKRVFRVPDDICDKGQGVACVRFGGFAPDGKSLGLIVSIRPPQLGKSEVIIWRLDDQGVERFASRSRADAIAISRAGDRIATIMAAAPLEIGLPALLWDRKSGRHSASLGNYQPMIDAAARAKDGHIVVQTIERPLPNGAVAKLWDLNSGQMLATGFDPRDSGPRVTDISPDGDLMAQLEESGTVIIRDRRTGRIRNSFETKMTMGSRPEAFGLYPPPSPILAFGAEGRTLATVGAKQTTMWDARSGTALRTLAGAAPVVFSESGAAFAAMLGCKATVYDTTSGRQTATTPAWDECPSRGALAADGKRLLWLKSGGIFRGPAEARVWTLADQSYVSLSSYPDNARAIGIFSPDGKTIATGGPEGTVSLWDPLTGRRFLTLPGSKDEPVSSLRFSDDGQMLVVGHEKKVKLWQAVADSGAAAAGWWRTMLDKLWRWSGSYL